MVNKRENRSRLDKLDVISSAIRVKSACLNAMLNSRKEHNKCHYDKCEYNNKGKAQIVETKGATKAPDDGYQSVFINAYLVNR